MDAQLRQSLLASVASHRLVLLTGAGLSMSPPSKLLPAWQIAEMCYETYVSRIGPLPVEIRHNLESVAEAIKNSVDFGSVFIKSVVPWKKFVAPPNAGHEAAADMLLTGAAVAYLTANYDMLVERVAEGWGADLQTALAGDEATAMSAVQSPFLKFHGCMTKDRERTVWTGSQFETDDVLAARKASNIQWMEANLQHKDLLIIGFWTDWSYLNSAFEHAITNLHPASITIIDPIPTDQLKEKAPGLWALANQGNVIFTHVREYGHTFLGELRHEIGLAFFRQFLHGGAELFKAYKNLEAVPAHLTDAPDLKNDDLYSWRRDAEGKTVREPSCRHVPDDSYRTVALAHLLLRDAGATVDQMWYDVGGKKIRVVNGNGQLLAGVKETFSDGPAVVEPDIVICVGALDLVVPTSIVRNDPETIVRPGSK
ncbi:SIR2 family protein, partial [Mesorhizobium sp. M7A.T.Ca.TU.009.01.3.2]